MNDGAKWLDEFHDGQRDVREVARYLMYISNALDTCGNVTLSQELKEMGGDLRKAADKMGGAIGTMLSDDVAEGRKRIGETLMAVLEACEKK